MVQLPRGAIDLYKNRDCPHMMRQPLGIKEVFYERQTAG